MWDKMGRREFERRLGQVEGGEGGIEEEWEWMEGNIKDALKEAGSEEEGKWRAVGRGV